MKKIFTIIFNITVLLLFFAEFVFSGNYRGTKEWLIEPPSARGAALGGGLAAIIDDANTVFWNPGGVTFLKGFNISRSHSPNILTSEREEYEMYNFAFNTNLGKSFVIGLNIQRYRREFREYYEPHFYDPTYNYLYQDSMTGFLLGYKRGALGMGINTKFLLSSSRYSAIKYIPFALDIGVLYSKDFFIRHIYPVNAAIGFSILNISSGITYEITGTPRISVHEVFPTIMRIGYSVAFKKFQKERELTPLSITHNLGYSIILNADKSYDKFADCQSLGLGFEVVTYEFLFSRIGYHFKESEKNNNIYDGITYGVGLNVPLYLFFKSSSISLKYDYGVFPWDTKSRYKRLNYTKIHSLHFSYTF